MVVALRYRVEVRGLDQVRGLRGPVLILPNHPGMIDPVLVIGTLWPFLRPRPMVFEGNFGNRLLRLLMKIMNAVWVPDLDQASMQARSRAQKAVAGVIEGLQRGENHILWPSGQLQPDGVERIGSARAVTDILSAVPSATVVLVRTRGVWGSMFSFAQTGEHPDLVARLRAGIGWLLANLLFFMPRRPVTIDIERVDPERLPERRREVLNPWLEAWFNKGGAPEKPTFVPYHLLLGPRSFDFPTIVPPEAIDPSRIRPATREAVNHIVADKLGRPLTPAEDRAETTLDNLGMDSLVRQELALAVEQRFGFTGDTVPATLGDLWALAQGLAHKAPLKPPPPE
jgi:long-chain-fatty-acid--[acyl-carrier-protein] ligase